MGGFYSSVQETSKYEFEVLFSGIWWYDAKIHQGSAAPWQDWGAWSLQFLMGQRFNPYLHLWLFPVFVVDIK